MSFRFPRQSRDLPAPLGVVYNTSMARPDAALALAALYVASSRRDARVNGICITGSGFDAAVFCDIVARFYTGTTRAPSSNTALPIGFPADAPASASPSTPQNPSSPTMVAAAINRKRPDGQPQYARTIQRVTDTSAPDALLRNAITFSAETAVVLSAPATWLARSLALANTPALYRERVKRIVIVDAGDLERDNGAEKKLLASLPFPAVLVGRDLGQALTVPVDRVATGLAWSPANPVGDAVGAARLSNVPLHDVAAMHYAISPASGFFTVAEGRLALNSSKRAECLDALVALATSKPAAPPARGGRG